LKQNSNSQKEHKSKIGGQALFQGVMMRGSGKEAMAVRKKDGSIHLEVKDVPVNKWYQKTPFIRGVFNFVLQMKNGYSYLMKSMEISGFLDEDDGDAPAAAESVETTETTETAKEVIEKVEEVIEKIEDIIEKVETKEKSKSSKAADAMVGILGMVFGIALAIGLFMFVPNWTATFVNSQFEQDMERYHSLIAGIIRIILFVGYMWAVSLMKEIRMTYEYHGAEHKTIAAFEGGEKLDPENVENVKKYRRCHPRCGTSFIFIVLTISILVYSILPIRPTHIQGYAFDWFGIILTTGWANVVRTVVQILFLPVLVSISYEIIKLAGRYDKNIIMRIISAPGLGLQRLTTKEPSERQLQVAVTAMVPVLPEDIKEDNW
jgi:uncharacterized protein YqhQ